MGTTHPTRFSFIIFYTQGLSRVKLPWFIHHAIGTVEQAGLRAEHLVSDNHKIYVDCTENDLFLAYGIQQPINQTGLLCLAFIPAL